MLFAAGFGTRMGDLTAERPKPMVPVAGRPLIDHTLDLVAPLNLSRVVVNLHYKPQPLIDHLLGRDIAFSREMPEILDTGGGLRHALPLLGAGPVFTMNTDAVWRGANPLEVLRAAWAPERMEALLICIPPAQAVGHKGQGDFEMDREGRISRGPGLIFGGAQIINPGVLSEIGETAFSLNQAWNRIADRGRLFGVTYPGRWCDVGHPAGIDLAEALLDGRDV